MAFLLSTKTSNELKDFYRLRCAIVKQVSQATIIVLLAATVANILKRTIK